MAERLLILSKLTSFTWNITQCILDDKRYRINHSNDIINFCTIYEALKHADNETTIRIWFDDKLCLHYATDFTTVRTYQPLFGAPLGVTPLEFRLDFWRQKTRVSGLSYGVVCVILHLAVLIQYRRLTDWRTGGRTNSRTTDTRRQHFYMQWRLQLTVNSNSQINSVWEIGWRVHRWHTIVVVKRS